MARGWSKGKVPNEVKQKIADGIKAYYKTHPGPNTGVRLSHETRRKISDKRRTQGNLFPRTPEWRKRVGDGQKRQSEEIDKALTELRAEGYAVLRVDKVLHPDALAKRDGKLYAVEVFHHRTKRKSEEKYAGRVFDVLDGIIYREYR